MNLPNSLKPSLRLLDSLIALVLLIALGFVLSGCSTLDKALLKPFTRQEVVTVPSHTTSQVITNVEPQIKVITNMVEGAPRILIQTNFVPVYFTNQVLVPAQAVTNNVTTGYEVNETVTKGLATAQRLNSSLNPTPTAPVVDLVLGLLGTASLSYAAYKNKKLQAAQASSEAHEGALRSVVAAVETFSGGTPDEIKAHIQTTARMDGTQAHLDGVVKSVTA